MTALLAAVLLGSRGASTNGDEREHRLSGASFTSTIDAGWTVHARAGARGFETFALSSTRARLDAQGIPPAGAIGITITESAPTAIARRAPARPGGESPAARAPTRAEAAIALMSHVVRTPSSAQGVELSEPARFRALAGVSAAEESYEYLFGKRGNVQVDVVARRADRTYFIELDTELANVARGESALAALLRNWRWR